MTICPCVIWRLAGSTVAYQASYLREILSLFSRAGVEVRYLKFEKSVTCGSILSVALSFV